MKALRGCAVVLDCLPGTFAPIVAAIALRLGAHYANLTEYVEETEAILAMGRGAETALLLQTGLAPGVINQLALKLYGELTANHGPHPQDSVEMRVGALTRVVHAPSFYAFTWSPVGVATEYVKPSIVLESGVRMERPALSDQRSSVLFGDVYEEALTSGGAADLPDALAGLVSRVKYATLRHPGHWDWVRSVLAEIGEGEDVIGRLQDRMEREVPREERDDVVVLSASVTRDLGDRAFSLEAAYRVLPTVIGGVPLRAIQSTTAAGLAESALYLLTNPKKGAVLQSHLDSAAFLRGPFISRIYGPGRG